MKMADNGAGENCNELIKPILMKNGRFENPFTTWHGLPSFSEGCKFLGERLRGGSAGAPPSEVVLNETLPVMKPSPEKLNNPAQDKLQYTWIGHATMLIQLSGFNVLTDPIFSDRCSPISFMGPKRYRPPPCTIEELPDIHAIVISHNHYDHLDLQSVKQLNAKYSTKGLRWFVPVGLQSWFVSVGVPRENVNELSWWESSAFTRENETVELICTPAQHWSMRNPFTDRNKSLWSSWVIKSGQFNVFFSGDTAYCEAFKVIGKQYGPFDLSAIAIGAYSPRFFMENQHINPEEALTIHEELRSKLSVGIHWGTFPMGSTEPYLEPKEMIEELQQSKSYESPFITVKHGDVRTLS